MTGYYMIIKTRNKGVEDKSHSSKKRKQINKRKV